MPYLEILVGLFFLAFFAKGARMEGRSPVIPCLASLCSFAVVTRFVLGGIPGLLLSQLLLFGLLTAFGLWRQERSEAPGR
jgi:hypothetical protein